MYMVKLYTIENLADGVVLAFDDINQACEFCYLAENASNFVTARIFENSECVFEFLA